MLCLQTLGVLGHELKQICLVERMAIKLKVYAATVVHQPDVFNNGVAPIILSALFFHLMDKNL